MKNCPRCGGGGQRSSRGEGEAIYYGASGAPRELIRSPRWAHDFAELYKASLRVAHPDLPASISRSGKASWVVKLRKPAQAINAAQRASARKHTHAPHCAHCGVPSVIAEGGRTASPRASACNGARGAAGAIITSNTGSPRCASQPSRRAAAALRRGACSPASRCARPGSAGEHARGTLLGELCTRQRVKAQGSSEAHGL